MGANPNAEARQLAAVAQMVCGHGAHLLTASSVARVPAIESTAGHPPPPQLAYQPHGLHESQLCCTRVEGDVDGRTDSGECMW